MVFVVYYTSFEALTQEEMLELCDLKSVPKDSAVGEKDMICEEGKKGGDRI